MSQSPAAGNSPHERSRELGDGFWPASIPWSDPLGPCTACGRSCASERPSGRKAIGIHCGLNFRNLVAAPTTQSGGRPDNTMPVQVRVRVRADDLQALNDVLRGSRDEARAAAYTFLQAATPQPGDKAPVDCANPSCQSVQGDVKFKKCSRCLSVSYCCSQCQPAHWRQPGASAHKRSCKPAVPTS